MSFFYRYIDICLYSVISISFSSVFESNSFGDFEILLILTAVLLPIKSPVALVAYWIALFEAVFITSAVDLLALSRRFYCTYCSSF